MIRLNLATGPEWLDLGHGVRLCVLPLTSAVMMAARKGAQAEIARFEDRDTEGIDPDTDSLGLAMAKAVARITVTNWEGVGDDLGQPIPVSPDGIDALLDLWPVFEAFQTQYVARAMLLDAEKNASSPLPSGSSAGATATAQPVDPTAQTAQQE
jgi:hypothetical protein